MISLLRRYALALFAITYLVLFLIVALNEELEAYATVTAFFFTLLVVVPWLVWQIRSLLRLKNEKAKTELLHLKSQVSPHFFFNTLNNLYGLIQKDSKKAQELVLKLSDMMRYSIYEGQKDWVTLEEEEQYLKNYIELHKMRYHKHTNVQFSSHIQKEKCEIMPLLFIILLENAFKHGVEKLRKDAYIDVYLSAGENEIHFTVENNFDQEEEPQQGGLGLKNLKRRLELMYPKKHSLNISREDGVFKAQLFLKQ